MITTHNNDILDQMTITYSINPFNSRNGSTIIIDTGNKMQTKLARTSNWVKAGDWIVLKTDVFRQTVDTQHSQFHILLS